MIFNLSVRAMSHLLCSTSMFGYTTRVRQEHRKQYNAMKREIAKLLGVAYNEVDECFKNASVNRPFKSMWNNLKDLGAEEYEIRR